MEDDFHRITFITSASFHVTWSVMICLGYFAFAHALFAPRLHWKRYVLSCREVRCFPRRLEIPIGQCGDRFRSDPVLTLCGALLCRMLSPLKSHVCQYPKLYYPDWGMVINQSTGILYTVYTHNLQWIHSCSWMSKNHPWSMTMAHNVSRSFMTAS